MPDRFGYETVGKRVLDIILAALAWVAALVPMALIALVIRLRMGSPVLFMHTRTGRHGKPFQMVKFRTMRHPEPGVATQSSERLTGLGLFLRGYSLDELPQLVNVIRGEMSLVGPRPLPPMYDDLYSDEQRRRFEVRPGLTGLAQVSGRSQLAWTDKFALDVEYVDNISLATDVRIIAQTARKLTDRSSTVADGGLIQERFDGTN